MRPEDPRFDGPVRPVPDGAATHGLRTDDRVDVARVSDSCGYAVPFMDYVGERTLLDEWRTGRQDAPSELGSTYRRPKTNAASIDGLPALDAGRAASAGVGSEAL